MMYDDRPAMVLSNIHILTKTLGSGQQFSYEFDYDKRLECSPPSGSGEVTYRVWFDDGNGYERFHVVDPTTISYADPAQHHRTTKVSLPPLDPGKYMLQWRSHFVCSGASKPQTFDGPMMPFEVEP